MSKINIIYLLPEIKNPTGGAKVIYNHSIILNKCGFDVNCYEPDPVHIRIMKKF